MSAREFLNPETPVFCPACGRMLDVLIVDPAGELIAHQLQVQYHDITDAANLETWRGMSYQTVLKPDDETTGKVIYPWANAIKA